MTNTEWGCEDGVHSGWLIVDVNDRSEALQLIPPQYRASSRVVRLKTWGRAEIEAMVQELGS